MNWGDSCSSQNGAEVEVAASHFDAFRWGAEWCGVYPGTYPNAMGTSSLLHHQDSVEKGKWRGQHRKKSPSCAPPPPSWWLQHQQSINLITRPQRNGTSPFHDGGGSGPGTGEGDDSVPSQNVVWPNMAKHGGSRI